MSEGSISAPRLVAYSMPIVAIEFVIYPTLAILPAFYVHRSGGGLAAYATALLVSRIVYSCGGPVVGYVSDRVATPWGRRTPWIVLGTILEILSVYMLFVPPPHAGPTYFAWASGVALFGFSMIDVPYIAWGSEISREYRARSRIASYRGVCAIAGEFIFLALPLLPVFGRGGLLEAPVVARLGIVAMLLLAITIAAALAWGPKPDARISDEPARESLPVLARAMARNKPMLWLCAALVFTFLPSLVQATVMLPLLASLGLTTWFSAINIAGLGVSILSMPLWLRLTYRVGKHRAWAIGLAVTFVSLPAYFGVAHIFGALAGLFALSILGFLSYAQVAGSLPYAVMGDVIDYDELRTGANHAANYSAIVLLIIRLQTAIGGSLALYILAAMHFDVHAVDPALIQPALIVSYFIVPGISLLLGILCMLAYPIDARRQSIVRRRLERRIS